MLTIILIVLGYIVIGGIIGGVIDATTDNIDFAWFCGLLWPLAVPLLIISFIMMFIMTIVSFSIEAAAERVPKERE